MGRLILIIAMMFAIVGCQSQPTHATIVKVPIVVCPIPEYLADPILPTTLLTNDDKGDWEKIAKSYATTVVRQEAYINQLKAQLQVYRDTRGEQK